MNSKCSPTLRRRRLARLLRQMRENAGLTLTQAAPLLDKKKSSLGRIENGETAADVHLVRTMMDVYDHFDPALIELARDAMAQGWWLSYGVRDRGYLGMESEAATCRELSLMYVPGLLQTEEYMRHIFPTGSVAWTTKQIENLITVRLIRQDRLSGPNPLSLVAVIDEAALRKPFGGPAVMRAQLEHLIACARRDNITIQILPDDLAGHEGMDGAFTLLDFPELTDPELLFVVYPTGASHMEKPEQVKEARRLFDRLRAVALSPADSLDFIQRVADKWYAN